MKLSLCFAAIAVVLPCFDVSRAAEFVPLGDLPGGLFFSQAFDVSDDGAVVSGSSVVANQLTQVPIRWTKESGMVQIADGGIGTSISGVG